MTADQDVNDHLGGRDANGGVLDYQFTPETLGRVTYSSNDDKGPFRTNFGHGDVVGSSATYDQVTSMLVLSGSRHVDPLGNVANPKKVWLIQWYWMLDGAPTPLTRDRLALYIKLADQLRPWPADFKGAMPGEPTADYSGVNQNAPLDSFDPKSS